MTEKQDPILEQLDTSERKAQKTGAGVTTTTTSLEGKKIQRFRPSPSLYRFTYSALVARDTEACQICRSGPPLDVDHADGHKETWRLDRLRLLCRRCNVSLQFKPTTSANEGERNVGAGGASAEWEASQVLRPGFSEWLRARVATGEPLSLSEAVYGSAKILVCSSQTTRRYLYEETSRYGEYELCRASVKIGRSFMVVRRREQP